MTTSVARSLDELLAGATQREPVKHADSKSGADFERLTIDGVRYLVKIVDGRHEWLAHASVDDAGRAVCLWEDGVYSLVPPGIDHTVVGAARLGAPGEPWPTALLMRDVGPSLIPEDAPVSEHHHDALLAAMADLQTTLRPPPRTTYMPFAVNYAILSPGQAVRQEQAGTAGGPQPYVTPGWVAVADEAPAVYDVVRPLLADPRVLVDALLATPTSFLHGDWKMGNLGVHPDGRVVLLDWDRPQVGPVTADLAWYLAVNCDRLPESKEAAAERFRGHLRRRGWDTEPWWERQLALTLLGAFLMLGWSKAGQPEELGWWADQVVRAHQLLI